MAEIFRVVEARNPNAVHAYGTKKACREWIARQPQLSISQPGGGYRKMDPSEFQVQIKAGGVWGLAPEGGDDDE